MNLANEFTENDIKILKNIEIDIEDREYSKEELIKYKSKIIDYIMNESTKGKDISILLNQYSHILKILEAGISDK